MTDTPQDITQIRLAAPFRVARLDARKERAFDLQPDAALRAQIAACLGLDALRKFRFHGTLRPFGKRDWSLEAQLGATVVQPCAVTLAPVVTRIDEPILRRFLADMPEPVGLEVEMPEDDSAEPLGTEIDLSALALEALSLALPSFPRAEGAALAEMPETTEAHDAHPFEEERPKPFAALAALKDKLGPKGPRDT